MMIRPHRIILRGCLSSPILDQMRPASIAIANGGVDDTTSNSSPSIEGDQLERLLQQLEQLTPVPVRGLFRRAAVRQAGPVRSDEFRALSEIFVWLTKVLRWGSFIRLPEPLYYRLDHADNFHKDHTTWPVERRRAAWSTMFTGMLEAIMPACKTLEEKLYVQQLILDRVAVYRPGRSYQWVPANADWPANSWASASIG